MTARAKLRNRQRHRRAVRKHFAADVPWVDWVSQAPRWLSRMGGNRHPRAGAAEGRRITRVMRDARRRNRVRVVTAGRRSGHASGAFGIFGLLGMLP